MAVRVEDIGTLLISGYYSPEDDRELRADFAEVWDIAQRLLAINRRLRADGQAQEEALRRFGSITASRCPWCHRDRLSLRLALDALAAAAAAPKETPE